MVVFICLKITQSDEPVTGQRVKKMCGVHFSPSTRLRINLWVIPITIVRSVGDGICYNIRIKKGG